MISVLPMVERVARVALAARGIRGSMVPTSIGRVHVYEGQGRGPLPPIAMVHGIGSAAIPFGPVLARFQPHVSKVIAPDLPGHGFSDAPRGRLTPEVLFDAMRDVLDRVLTEPTILCGSSLGGGIVMRYAHERPDRIRGLVLLSPAGARMNEVEIEEIRRIFHMTSDADARAFLHRLYHRVPRFVPLISREVRLRMANAAVRDLLTSARSDHAASPEELAALTMPVLLSWGRSERILPPSCLAYFREHLPRHAIIEEPEGIGHCPHLDDPGRLARRILSFARTLSAPDQRSV